MTAKDWRAIMAEGAWKNGPWFVLFLALVLPFSYASGKGLLATVERFVVQSEINNEQLRLSVAEVSVSVKHNGEQIAATLALMEKAKDMMSRAPEWHKAEQDSRDKMLLLLQELIDEVRKNASAVPPIKSGGTESKS